MLIAALKNKFIVLFNIIIGTLSFPIIQFSNLEFCQIASAVYAATGFFYVRFHFHTYPTRPAALRIFRGPCLLGLYFSKSHENSHTPFTKVGQNTTPLSSALHPSGVA